MLGEDVAIMTFSTVRLGQLGHVMGCNMILTAVTAVTVNSCTSNTSTDCILNCLVIAHMAGLTVIVVGCFHYCADCMAAATVAHRIDIAVGRVREWIISATKYRYICGLTLAVDLVQVIVNRTPVTSVPLWLAVLTISTTIFELVVAFISSTAWLHIASEEVENTSTRSWLVLFMPTRPCGGFCMERCWGVTVKAGTKVLNVATGIERMAWCR